MDVTARYGSLELKNPIIASSAGITAYADRMKRAEDAGAAAVVMKSLFENPIPRTGDPSPHMLILRQSLGPMTSESFYSYEQASHLDEHAYADELRRAKDSLQIPVIANLDCSTYEAWIEYASIVEQAGADAIEVKMCPHAEHSRSLPLDQAIRAVKTTVKVPVIAKILPQIDDPVATYLKACEAGADGVVMFNRFAGLDIDTKTRRPVMHGSIAGFGGAWYIHYCLRWIAECHARSSVPICGSGGVGSGDDIVKYILAGASAVEVATLIILEGYSAISRLLREVSLWMQEQQVHSLMQVIGTAAASVKRLDQVDRVTQCKAVIHPDACVSCGQCEKCCFRQAVTGAPYRVIPELCEGCGLCVHICPANAIGMTKA